MKKIAVLLSGCGVYDGSEIHESTLTLLHLNKQGHAVQCFSLAKKQHHVVHHNEQSEQDESRCILTESARISRGNILPISEYDDSYDALIIPGGFGVAKNFSDFAFAGENMKIDADIKKFIQKFSSKNKPIGWLCISPIMMPEIYGHGVKGTSGTCPDTSKVFNTLGGDHQSSNSDEVIVDEVHKAVSTPAYMNDASIAEIDLGISKLIKTVVTLI